MPLPIPRPDRKKHPHYGQMHHEMAASQPPQFPTESEFTNPKSESDMGTSDAHNNNHGNKETEKMPVAPGGSGTQEQSDAGEKEGAEGLWETEKEPLVQDNFEQPKNITI